MNEEKPILLVEDNPMDVDLTMRAFSRRKIVNPIEVARDGEEALAMIPKWEAGQAQPCVILLDLKLPKIGGLEVLRKLKIHPVFHAIPIVVLTTSADDIDITTAYSFGANSYIVKPVSFEKFLEVAAHALRLGVHGYVVKHQGYLFELPSVLESAHNRSRLKQEKAALKTSEQKYRLLAETALDFILTHDLDGRITFANQAAIISSGYGREEILSKNVTDFVPHGQLQEMMQRQELRVAGNEDRHLYETEFINKAGEIIPVEVSSSAIIQNNEICGVLLVARDISQRKLAELSLINSEDKYRTLFETMTQGVVYTSADGRNISANTSAAKLFDMTREEILGENPPRPRWRSIKADGSYFPREEYPAFVALRTGKIVENVLMGLHYPASDEVRWLSVNAVPQFKGGDKKPYQVYSTFEDITRRKQAIEEVHALSERLKHYFATSPTIIYALLLDGDIEVRWVSENITRIMGYSEEEVLRPGWWLDNVHPDDRERAGSEKKALREGGALVHEYRFLAKNGREYWVRDESRLILDHQGHPAEIVGGWTDITERIRSEIRIMHLNRVLRAIREINHLIVHERNAGELIRKACNILIRHRGYNRVLIVLIDETGRPNHWNQAGWDDKYDNLVEMFHQGDIPPCCRVAESSTGIGLIREKQEKCLNCPLQPEYMEWATMCRKLEHGDTIFGYLLVSIDHDLVIEEEEQAIFIEMASDLSFGLYNIAQSRAIVRAEEARNQMEAELRQAQKMEAIGRLAGGVAHDFNNMISVISGYANLALMRLDTDDPLYQNLIEIDQAAMRSVGLTRQLLAFSRKQAIEPMVLNLNEIVDNQLKMLGRLIGEDIEITFARADDAWAVLIDPSQVNQILANLAVNARDAIEGVGVVSIETANVRFEVVSESHFMKIEPGEYVMISVSDTGFGIDAETLEHIFEPFYTTKAEGRGTGLGLSTVYGIVTQNNGAIHVYSEPGMGTVFKIYLPRYIGEAGTVEQGGMIPDLTGTETILVVEDETLVLNLAQSILKRRGYQVMAAEKPDQALALVEDHEGPIHLLLTDVVMPGMNGKELKDRIEELKPGIRTLFMSGYTADIISRHGVLEKGVNFIHKPFSLDSLSQKVREVLNG